jgi:hypothetical protein
MMRPEGHGELGIRNAARVNALEEIISMERKRVLPSCAWRLDNSFRVVRVTLGRHLSPPIGQPPKS